MRRRLLSSCMLLGLLAGASVANAQGILPLSVDVRGAYALPQGEWNENDTIENGFGYGIDLRVEFSPILSVYGGWDRYSFDMSDTDGDVRATDTGVHLGLQASLPLSGTTGISPFGFGGIIYNSTSAGLSTGSATIEIESDSEVGFEAGAGVEIPVTRTLSLVPLARYRTHSTEFTSSEADDLTVSYLSFELGLRLGL